MKSEGSIGSLTTSAHPASSGSQNRFPNEAATSANVTNATTITTGSHLGRLIGLEGLVSKH